MRWIYEAGMGRGPDVGRRQRPTSGSYLRQQQATSKVEIGENSSQGVRRE